ncbi:hypothetical protein D3C72_2040310 [compost metagenome]
MAEHDADRGDAEAFEMGADRLGMGHGDMGVVDERLAATDDGIGCDAERIGAIVEPVRSLGMQPGPGNPPVVIGEDAGIGLQYRQCRRDIRHGVLLLRQVCIRHRTVRAEKEGPVRRSIARAAGRRRVVSGRSSDVRHSPIRRQP